MRPISEYVSKGLVCVLEGSSVLDAVKVMKEKAIGAVLIVDEHENPIGIFTERDLLTKINFDVPAQLTSLKINAVMTRNIISVDQNQRYTDVINLMRQYNIRHIPITQDNKIFGMVSLRDLVQRHEEDLEVSLKLKEEELLAHLDIIKDSVERFRSIFNNSAVAIALFDNNERIAAWNPLVPELLCMDERDLKNKPAKELFPEAEWQKFRFLDLGPEGENRHLETKIFNKHGQLIDIELSISVIKNSAGQVTGAIGIMHDIRERKKIEENLGKYRRELENIKFGLDQHAIVAITDRKGIITYANDKFCEISGYSRVELVGSDHRIVNSGCHPKEYMRNLWRTILACQVWKGELRNRRKDGSFYWVDTTIVPLLDEQGTPFQFISIRTDISERKRYGEELELANRDLAANADALRTMLIDRESTNAKLRETQHQLIQAEKMASIGNLAAGVAHEVKNPLAIILQGMERVEKMLNGKGDESSRQYVNIIRSAALRANNVVTSLLSYSRSSHMEAKKANIYEIIEQAVQLIENNAVMSKIQIRKNYARKYDHILCDHIMIQQVFFDLFNNSIDAMPDGGEISVSVKFLPSKEKKEPGKYVINVKDTGEGIPEEHLSKIFDPFFTTKDEGKGSGLGLSTVYLILERHGGSISVQSKQGAGATFTITLPEKGQTEIVT